MPKPFDRTKTDMPIYDQMLADPKWAEESQGFTFEIQDARPMDYINACAVGFKSSVAEIERQRTESGKVDKYAKMLEDGTTFPMLVLQYSLSGHFAQEGLHRAFAAKQAGVDRVPIMVIQEQE